MEWRPSGWGQRVTRSPDWQLRLDGEQLALLIDGRQYRLQVANEHSVQVVRGVLWSRVELTTEHGEALSVDGLPNSQGSRLAAAVQHMLLRAPGVGARHCLSAFWRRSRRGWPTRRAYRPRHHRTPLDHPRTAAGVAGRPPRPAPAAAELEQLFLDEEVHDDLHAPSHRMALDALHDWQLDWPAAWAEANETMASASGCWPRTSWTGSRASR
jgi:DNA helicase-4